MKILSVGGFVNQSNTCLHRHLALEKLASKIDSVNTSPKRIGIYYKIAYRLFNYGLPIALPDYVKANKRIRELIKANEYDIVWIDKGNTISPRTLKFINRYNANAKVISYTADNMAERHNQSYYYLKGLGLYDYHVTTKSYIVDQLKSLGAQNVIFTNQSFESSFHFPRVLEKDDMKRLGADIGFVGAWEKERSESIEFLAKNGLNIKVFGRGNWVKLKGQYPNLIVEDENLYSEDYAKSFKAFKISLCFLRKMNSDLQTTRTMEIPACGGFMLAEKTDEHKKLFKEDSEAVYFSSNTELLEKCKYYLKNEEERKQIVEAGILRCKTSGYSNLKTIERILKHILEIRKC